MSLSRASLNPFARSEPKSAESGPIAKGAAQVASPAALESPTLFGRYALFGQIGAGGMGVVHLGRLLASAGFERAVAIKRVHPSLGGDEKFVSMFREELRLLARVRHQNVIAALDVLEVDRELLLVMEYVHGDSLASLLQKSSEAGKALPLDMAVTIACGVLKGLHAAHVATSPAGEPLRIIHRDVSPHNVLVGCDGCPRVVDFGVAKSTGSRQLTRVGELRGKPGYVSPEQIRGERLTARADVYALSVVLWEMLAGRRLFGSRSLPQTIEDILAGNVPPLGAVTNAPISPELEAIVRRGLNTDDAVRFASARDMALALEAEVRPVSPELIGAWVEATAADVLAERARQLAWAETCPVGDEEVTKIGPPPALELDETWSPQRTPTPAPFMAPPATTPVPERPETMTRELSLSELIPASAAPAPATAAPEPGSIRRRVLFGAAGAVTLVVGANMFSEGALFRSWFGAGRASTVAHLQPSPPPRNLEPPPAAPAPTARPASIAADTLPLEGSAPKAVVQSAKPTPAAPGPSVRKAPPTAVKRPAPAKPKKSSVDGF